MSRKESIRYEIDPHNRLIIAKSGRKSELAKYRKVIEGKFEIDRKNRLTYHIKESQDSKIPQQLRFSGNWSMSNNHDLVLTLNKWGNQIAGDKLTIKGEILDAESNKLLFAVTTKTPDGHAQVYILKFSGQWQADKNNRLLFNLKKEKGTPGTLALEGAWEINKHNQLVYRYTKKKQAHSLAFKGYWDITDKFRFSYILIGTKQPPIVISGRWMLDKKYGLIFEARYREGRVHTVIFGADIELNKRNNLELRLKNKRGKDLGIELAVSRKMLKGAGEAFIKVLTSKHESALHAGTGLRW